MKRTTILLLATLAGCAGSIDPQPATSGDPLTSVGGTPRQIEWDAFVYVSPDADAGTIQATIARQIKSALGALREQSIGISDRAALHNLDPAGWTRDTLDVVGASGAVTGRVLRVRYHYSDAALVGNASPLGAGSATPGAGFIFTLLFGDYTGPAPAAALQPACVDEATDGDSLWYHFAPGRAECQALARRENLAIAAEQGSVRPTPGQLTTSDAARRFLPVHAKLTAVAATPTRFPEYDRLWGFGTDRQLVVAYAFVGVEHDERDSHDLSAVEYQRLLRTLRQRFPQLHVTYTQPYALLLDFYVDGKKLDNVSFDDVARWMIDGAGYPAEVGTDAAKIEALRQQVIDRFSERFLYWQLPVTVTRGGESRSMTVELRTFWGKEDGDPDTRQHATWRYLEAFWNADLFAYAGHSHFGHGPLEPTNYGTGNFPDRYQVMLVNSCLSYNYYDLDFINMHPEGARNLEVVTNGLPAYWNGMGESTAQYLIGLLDGTGKSYAQLLESMKVADPWGQRGYEPMRAVNGELDNVYDPAAAPISLVVGR